MGTCTVWWAAPVAPGGAPALVGLLDAHERERLGRFRREVDAARFLAAHALVRIALAGLLDLAPAALVFDRTCRCGQPHGKPRLTAGGPAFSLTHAGDLVGVAVHDAPVGLDVEQARPLTDLAAMAAHACAPGETAPDEAAFFRLWTRKEALLKASGDGLSAPMSGITLDTHGVVDWAGGPGPVWLRELSPAPEHPAAVAGLGTEAPPVVEADGDALLRAR
ncbi:4'-phosphopantetheinyl transferase superfamily protein [Pseudonocardia sp.]|uniref:4'-phosphopantetheinyl transferase family protein n=1 Tax=Pseudonocardia sp. TaxID=60912 RepID=UPI0026251BCE|nr:4'-phosphopantetheinyl transferase superfamily protein [Pseudonocardia sp.]